ncbi:MAG: hypothetical protein KDD62_09900 [Bdellovibrionales bacterium]|nr:hypothetical protein [Bdellovibrionales bacterium]
MVARKFLLLLILCFPFSAQADGLEDTEILQEALGKYPTELKLWNSPTLEKRLRALLGEKFPKFITNMTVNTPLEQGEDFVWSSGNKPHDGGYNSAMFVMDTAKNKIEVYLLIDQHLSHYGESSDRVVLNGDAQNVLANLEASAKGG